MIIEKITDLANSIEKSLSKIFEDIDQISAYNENKVLKAFLNCKISSTHFVESTGYGYGDSGREKIDKLYSKIFKSEDALVRSNFVCGTHTIATALFGVLRPKDILLCVTKTPYPTIRKTLGIEKNSYNNSLQNFGILYEEIDILNANGIDLNLLKNSIKKNTKMVYVQRSKGYSIRRSVRIEEIEKIANLVHKINPKTIVFVDNCYGEFVEKKEPAEVGADLVCGSLIKNPGGAIAKTGGYIVGKKELINLCAEQLTAPGLKKEVGCNFNFNKDIFLGIFLAPALVKNAMKISVLTRSIFEKLGFKVLPKPTEKISDIVSIIELNSKQALQCFCEGIQENSPIDSFATPVPCKMPGYENEVIMAAGSFVNGASLELSADAQICPPFNVFLQGGLLYHNTKTAILKTIEKMVEKKLIEL